MSKIIILSASVRLNRNSHRVALFFSKYITEQQLAEVEMLDLHEYKFPIFEERLRFMKDPPAILVEVSEKIKSADGILIVTPEYNGGYPAALKNFVDLLYTEWRRKPVALATVSDGMFGGAQVTTSFVFSMWKIGALVVPAMYPVPKVLDNYDPEGNATDKPATEKRAGKFVDELLWWIKATKAMEQNR